MPWGEKSSVYEHLLRHLHPEVAGLLPGGEVLPDDEEFWEGKSLRWAAGGLDGTTRRRASTEGRDARAAKLMGLLLSAADRPTPDHLHAMHDFLKSAPALAYVDDLLREVVLARSTNQRGNLTQIARWLATHSPDREPVKIGIALLGVLSDHDESDLVLTLGRHDEFTLFAAVALTHLYEFPDALLMELGKHVDGWGRIQIIERLSDTRNPEVQAWMLRQGFKNSVMYEYTAHICSVAGDLARELTAAHVDDELFEAATGLIDALLTGGPANDIDDYDDGVEAVQDYLRHVRSREPILATLRVLWLLRRRASRYVESKRTEAINGWTPAFYEWLTGECEEITSWPAWATLTEAALASTERRDFWLGLSSARLLGIDIWELCFEKLEAGEDLWFQVMETKDRSRAERVVAFATAKLPLARMASGPAMQMGQGPVWAEYRHLDWVLQGLEEFPHLGWGLIRTGFHSPVIRNRNMALKAFKNWSRAEWPSDALSVIKRALKKEPDPDVRARLSEFMAGA